MNMFQKYFFMVLLYIAGRSQQYKTIVDTFFLVSSASKKCYLCDEEKGGLNTCGDFTDTHLVDCDVDCVSVSFETWDKHFVWHFFRIDIFRKVFGKKIKTTEHSCSNMVPILGILWSGDACAGKHDKCYSHKDIEHDGITYKNMHVCCCSEEK